MSFSKNKMIYLDSAATTRPLPNVLDDITYASRNFWQNPSSFSGDSIEVRKMVEHERVSVADFLNAEPEEIYFCSSGTQANNLILSGILNTGFRQDGKRRKFYCGPTEHSSIRNFAINGYPNSHIMTKDDMLDFKCEFGDVVSYMIANNETGLIADVKSMAETVHAQGGYFHTDATAYAPHTKIDVKDLDVDALTFSGHKMNIPRGIAVMYVKNGTPFSPMMFGGHQESGIVPGTENTSLIYALGGRVRRLMTWGFEENKEHEENLLRVFDEVLNNVAAETHVGIHYNVSENCINTIRSVRFDGFDNQQLMTILNEMNVCCSAGSACNTGSIEQSYVLKYLGLSDEEIGNSLRFSLDPEWLIKEDIYEFGKRITKCLKALTMIKE